jgi:hypothetical protein
MKTTARILSLVLSAAALAADPPPAPAGNFKLIFQAYDGDTKHPAKMEFQVKPIAPGARTEFVKIGDTISGTNLKVVKFEFKEVKNAKSREKEDVSELTLTDPKIEKTFVAILNKAVDITTAK